MKGELFRTLNGVEATPICINLLEYPSDDERISVKNGSLLPTATATSPATADVENSSPLPEPSRPG